MIRMIQSASAGQAKTYFSGALLKSDYYINSQELQGRYQGRLAQRLGLMTMTEKESFFALCENVNPKTGEPLTPRKKEDRTVGYDISFHCPKGLSVLHSLSKDDHILKAFEESVTATMKDIEADSKTRVRKQGQSDDRKTGELLWAEFTHQTARPVGEYTPDPHLHSHCFVFNATWDETEGQLKAAQFRDVKRDMPYYQVCFHKRLSDRMIDLGYQVKTTDKAFEIEGVPNEVIDLFSKRTDEIGRVAKEKGIIGAKELDQLGARTRSKKKKGLSMTELKAEWRRQIKELGNIEGDNTKPIRHAAIKEFPKASAQDCINHAIDHSFERASVMDERRLFSTAARHSIGNPNVSLDDLTKEIIDNDNLLHVVEGSRKFCTTKVVLSEEKRMVEIARHGKNKFSPLYREVPEIHLNGQQAAAVAHILTTTDHVSIIRGAAGTGKTTLMREAVSLIEQAEKKVFVVAPTAEASRGVLKEEGFEHAETVAKLLVDEKMQDELQDQVLWVDEAGLLGAKDMVQLLELTQQKKAKLILGGDTRQHSSVIRGDALRILNTVGGIKTAEVSKIFRQKDFRYRAAVQDFSTGNIRSGFEKLDTIGAIKNINALNPNEDLATDYINTIKAGKTALVISPTHKQGDEVTKEIRKKMRTAGMIGKQEIQMDRLANLNFTEAQKSDWRNYKTDQVIQFNQNLPGVKRGSRWTVKNIHDRKVELHDKDGKPITLATNLSNCYDVFDKTTIGLSVGDKVRITRNGYDDNNKRLNNGMTLEVDTITEKGAILKNKISQATYSVYQDYGHLAHAHCITSHASQGKTVDEVFIHQPSETFPATDAKQFYVSASRGRDAVNIYTDDKNALIDYASELGDRQSALELIAKNTHNNHLLSIQRAECGKDKKTRKQTLTTLVETKNLDRIHEPKL